MATLSILEEKVDALIRRFTAVCTERDALLQKLDKSEEGAVIMQRELKDARQRLLAYEIGAAIPDAETRAGSRRKLDEVICDIDKILTTLDD